MKIGVIADTHSTMRPEALEAIAPVVAIRGNIDKTGRAATLPDVQDLELLGPLSTCSTTSQPSTSIPKVVTAW